MAVENSWELVSRWWKVQYRTMKKFPAIVALAAVAVVMLAGCTATSAPETVATATAEPAPETVTSAPSTTPATEEPTPEPTPAELDCVSAPTGRINMPSYAYNTEPVTVPELAGEISDTGPREFASGDPTLNSDGQIVSYTTEPGDAMQAIAARFCIDSYSFASYNHTTGYDIQPGDVLVLRPAPDDPWSWED